MAMNLTYMLTKSEEPERALQAIEELQDTFAERMADPTQAATIILAIASVVDHEDVDLSAAVYGHGIEVVRALGDGCEEQLIMLLAGCGRRHRWLEHGQGLRPGRRELRAGRASLGHRGRAGDRHARRALPDARQGGRGGCAPSACTRPTKLPQRKVGQCHPGTLALAGHLAGALPLRLRAGPKVALTVLELAIACVRASANHTEQARCDLELRAAHSASPRS